MPEGVKYEELKTQADTIYEAFEREFKRFEHFVGDRMNANRVTNLLSDLQAKGYSLRDAQTDLQELSNLRTRYMGKKSEWMATKKMIGRITDNGERAAAGQYLLMREVSMTDR